MQSLSFPLFLLIKQRGERDGGGRGGGGRRSAEERARWIGRNEDPKKTQNNKDRTGGESGGRAMEGDVRGRDEALTGRNMVKHSSRLRRELRKDGWRRDGDSFISISRGKHLKCSTQAELPHGSFQLTFLETTDTFTFVHVMGLCIRLTFVISRSCDLPVMCGDGGHDGGVTGQEAAKPAAAVGGCVFNTCKC